MYGQLGYRAPFIFGMICAAVDLVGRILVIEKTDADKLRAAHISEVSHASRNKDAESTKEVSLSTSEPKEESQAGPAPQMSEAEEIRLTEMQVLRRLFMKFRPAVVLLLTVVWG